MNREELKRRTEIQQAYLDGETIECGKRIFDSGHDYGVDKWETIELPIFNWEKFDYRVKPKVYVKPEDLEVGKTYIDEFDGEIIKVLESVEDGLWMRTEESGSVDYELRSPASSAWNESKLIEVTDDEQ